MTPKLIAIDPGVKKCAIAVFDDEHLTDAFYVTTERHSIAVGAIDMAKQMVARTYDSEVFDVHVVIERPQIYAGSKTKGDPNDLLDVAFVAGTFNADFSYLPAEWKGQVPKPIHHKRLGEFFEAFGLPSEMRLWQGISKLKKDHDLRDAVGLGLFHLGLVGKGGISK